MKALGVGVVGIAVCAAVASGDVTMITLTQQFALTTIDSVPSKTQLQGATIVVPDDLITIAANVDQKYTTAVRLRAIHGLAVYCTTPGVSCPGGSPAHDTLAALVTTNAGAQSGADLLVLRAAIESLGPLDVPDDLDHQPGPQLVTLLNHSSRDIRAATARALGQLCNTAAINPLRVRYQNESTDEVKLAISAALRILNQGPPCVP